MTKGLLFVDVVIIAAAIWFFALGWLVLALLATWIEPFALLYGMLSEAWQQLGALVERLRDSMGIAGAILGIALQGLCGAALGLALIGGWAMLPVWILIVIGVIGELQDRRVAARRLAARKS